MEKITISDISLKECLKNQAVGLTFKEKLEIVKRLCELGIDIVELPFATEKADEILVKTVCAFAKNTKISISASNAKEIESASAMLCNAKNSRVAVEIPVSPVYMEYFSAKKPKAVLEVVSDLTAKASATGIETEVNFIDATRADVAFLCQAIKTAIECGANVVSVTDLAGVMTPEEFGSFIEELYKSVPELENVKLGIQLSDAFAMATASVLTAFEKGVREVKVSAVSVRGLADFETFAKTMEFLASKRGFVCGINKTLTVKTLSRIENLAARRGVLGALSDGAEDKGEINKDISEQDLSVLVSENGYDISSEDFEKVFAEFKRIAERKTVTLSDLEVIISNVVMQVPETYVLDKFSVNSSNVLRATASICLKKEGKEIFGLSFGNGAVDACFLALENIAGEHFELENFEIGAVTAGKEAMAQAIVKLRSDGKVFTGRGISTDVVGASIRGYVNALNKIVYERGNK